LQGKPILILSGFKEIKMKYQIGDIVKVPYFLYHFPDGDLRPPIDVEGDDEYQTLTITSINELTGVCEIELKDEHQIPDETVKFPTEIATLTIIDRPMKVGDLVVVDPQSKLFKNDGAERLTFQGIILEKGLQAPRFDHSGIGFSNAVLVDWGEGKMRSHKVNTIDLLVSGGA